MADLPYKRVLLKLSGEALAGNQGFGVEAKTIQSISRQIIDVFNLGKVKMTSITDDGFPHIKN